MSVIRYLGTVLIHHPIIIIISSIGILSYIREHEHKFSVFHPSLSPSILSLSPFSLHSHVLNPMNPPVPLNFRLTPARP